jgi:hypothetical protein
MPNEALGADGRAPTELVWIMLPPPFVCVAGDCKINRPPKLALSSAKRSERSFASTALSYATNVHYASLNIIFVSRCKFINFRSSSI